MIYLSRWRILATILVCVAGIIFSIPNLLHKDTLEALPAWLQNTVSLGLELQGGSHIQLEVDLKSVQRDHLNSLLNEIRSALKKERIGYTRLTIHPESDAVQVILRASVASVDTVVSVLKKELRPRTVDVISDKVLRIQLPEDEIRERHRLALDKSIEVIRHRVDETGTKEPLIQRQSTDRIIVQLPGVDDPSEVKRLIGKTAKLSFHLVDHDYGEVRLDDRGRPAGVVPPGTMILPEQTHAGHDTWLPVKRQVAITGDHLLSADFSTDQKGPGVSIHFDAMGTKQFAEITRENINRRFAIVLDGRVISAPVVNQYIPTGTAVISGSFTNQEAHELALLLRSGALPAPLKVLEERTVGPSLGADSIQDGKTATTFAFALVVIFMILNYSLFGVFAGIALLFNMLLLFSALSLLKATLTLPGIAGIALTIGMAVDANVLIFERIREELRQGLRPVLAIEAGYRKALATILDTNLTTFIGAAVLFEFGSGPIRGFAVTLALGIMISLFSAISLTRLMIVWWLQYTKPGKTLPI